MSACTAYARNMPALSASSRPKFAPGPAWSNGLITCGRIRENAQESAIRTRNTPRRGGEARLRSATTRHRPPPHPPAVTSGSTNVPPPCVDSPWSKRPALQPERIVETCDGRGDLGVGCRPGVRRCRLLDPHQQLPREALGVVLGRLVVS